MVAAAMKTTRGDSTFPVYTPMGQGEVAFAYGVFEVPSSDHLEAGDTITMCWVPKGAYIIDGFIRADDLDTGTEALDIDVGVSNTATDALGLGNLGVWTGDAIAGFKPEVMNYFPFNGTLKDGPIYCVAETQIFLTCNTAANAGHVGTIYCGVYYVVP